ncbi:NUDIX domain-containing protein [Sphingomonas sp. JC676]|uniref:NUDIX hydrolase n=1 Tax=Sphingomonas sp. JC676 TaxID=2768065 RepID=UPI0016581C86|nr:NUDIX domain-containing protein [Sphingomonas sp. JC676]MBC9032960.1 NUDIX domain-containing protein [Sphingomonas sp. JC676]
MSEPEAIPAATVIVMRECAGGPPELLMVERAQAMAFAGGALVFPGGRIDAGDHVLAALHSGDPDDIAARIAAVRETLEEAGVAVGLDVDGDAIPALKHRLYAGEPMGALIEEMGGTLRLDALVPFARWLPDNVRHRVFDTRFYLARAPQDAAPVVDGNENVRVFWATAQAVLDAADAGEATIIFPTRRNLERLARFASFEEAASDANRYPIRTVTPWIETRDDGQYLCIPDDLGYPVTEERLDRAIRA